MRIACVLFYPFTIFIGRLQIIASLLDLFRYTRHIAIQTYLSQGSALLPRKPKTLNHRWPNVGIADNTKNKMIQESTPASHNILPPFKHLYATLPESTPSSQNIPPSLFSTTICDAPKIYSSLSENTLFLNMHLPLPLIIHPPFEHLYATLSEYCT